MTEKKWLIFDCDPGIDDAYALAYLRYREEFDVKLLCSVHGNVCIDNTTKNLRGIAKLLDWDVKLVRGAHKPLIGKGFNAEEIHGKSGLGSFSFDDNDLAPIADQNVNDAYVEVLKSAPHPVIIAGVGPLTNIATLLELYPNLHNKIDRILIMGGGLKNGNATMCAEFNYYADPEAAAIVFKHNIPLYMAGLDVTERCNFYQSDIDKLISMNPKIGNFLHEISQDGLSRRGRLNLNDVVAIMAYTHPEVFKMVDLHVQIETGGTYTRGMSIADQRQRPEFEPNCKVLMDVDQQKFVDVLIETLGGAK